ncbi:type I-E CRISPR-associated endoribonuclease Cas2e [Leucobacter sp. HNU]|uniref:type I-E CRISPR-associated endoribonuclease Cas2e n=1 Tax=Leucobacter sp. HNU TaxID=3236805 RepID=UPI003A80AF12
MIVLVLTAVPTGLRGFLTRWLMEISSGVFVGKVSGRVRELLWERTTEMIGQGRAVLVRSVRTEQGLDVRVHGHHWEPIDIDGITLMLRPNVEQVERGQRPERSEGSPVHAVPGDSDAVETSQPRKSTRRGGWSNAAKRYRFGR